ncbi:hypothetical protein M5K25_009244 [Dendrobium thyrsiflorum]|uniref:Reverse transcriptase zinc-binding domain-containing protein n=1 Tax=Dendrobium thyrsiflorum TaxID=117978 RepID=A0ABD0V503_DENTH
MSKAFSHKLWFSFREGKSLWAKFLNFKYCKRRHPTLCTLKSVDSNVWKRLCSVKEETESFIQWGLGKGDISFWHDNWLGMASIDNLLNSHTLEIMKVKNFWKEGNWWIEKLLQFVPPELVDIITSIPLNTQEQDRIMYSGSSTGAFSLKVAWNSFRSLNDKSNILALIWHNSIPVSYSILTWRLIKGFIPVDDRLKLKGFQGPSKCQCCYHNESIKHVFLDGFFAKQVWKYFYALTNKTPPNCYGYITDILKDWFVPVKGHILNVLPILILWFIWRSRNEAKHTVFALGYRSAVWFFSLSVWCIWSFCEVPVGNFCWFVFNFTYILSVWSIWRFREVFYSIWKAIGCLIVYLLAEFFHKSWFGIFVGVVAPRLSVVIFWELLPLFRLLGLLALRILTFFG